ncbi:MAG TPA: hypothetical protein VMV96_05210 [Acidimicrobiales bacterium]|nr:hypothetical protein [Acidimicrobiales bacterium]
MVETIEGSKITGQGRKSAANPRSLEVAWCAGATGAPGSVAGWT